MEAGTTSQADDGQLTMGHLMMDEEIFDHGHWMRRVIIIIRRVGKKCVRNEWPNTRGLSFSRQLSETLNKIRQFGSVETPIYIFIHEDGIFNCEQFIL